MAVVFISPKKRQRALFTIIGLVFLLIIVIVYLLVFFAKPLNFSSTPVFNLSKANIDFSVFDSPQFKQLQPFTELSVQSSQAGRDNPFVPYYQVTTISNPTPTPTPIPTSTPIASPQIIKTK